MSKAMAVIRHMYERDDDGARLYWSNDLGWTRRTGATVFTTDEMHRLNLPLMGEWASSRVRRLLP